MRLHWNACDYKKISVLFSYFLFLLLLLLLSPISPPPPSFLSFFFNYCYLEKQQKYSKYQVPLSPKMDKSIGCFQNKVCMLWNINVMNSSYWKYMMLIVLRLAFSMRIMIFIFQALCYKRQVSSHSLFGWVAFHSVYILHFWLFL